MKRILMITVFLLCQVTLAQERYKTSEGILQFDASTPLEDIHAVNSEVNAILVPESGEIAVLLLHKDFIFKRRLMQEHYNENFMESDLFPKALFKGQIVGFSLAALSDTPEEFPVKGTLTVHGVTRELVTTLLISRVINRIRIRLAFKVKTEDYNIKVPKVLFKKVAEEVDVSGDLTLRPIIK